jgi:dGTPase
MAATGESDLERNAAPFGGATPDAPPWSLRRHAAESEASRGAYQIDRDRIVHSESFRELQYKTAVRSPTALLRPDGPLPRFRTRLNHVLEVAQLARGIARALGANEPLAEAIALAHDLGHAPFGHAGERALAEAVRDHGGDTWNANLHSLTVVDGLECSFVGFRGLDLTWATREGLARHTTPFDVPAAEGEFVGTPSSGLESQIVDVADFLAYTAHDLDDALAAGLSGLDELAAIGAAAARIVEDAERAWHDEGRNVWPDEERGTVMRRRIVAKLIAYSCQAVEGESTARLVRVEASPEAIRATVERIVTGDEEWEAATRALLDLLVRRYYRSDEVRSADADAAGVIRETFSRLIDDGATLPERFRSGHSVLDVAAYLASLNDFSLLAAARSLGVPTPAEPVAQVR